jgi:hypothetical protein
MEALAAWRGIEPFLGAILMTVALVDIFLTVLYARTHMGLISDGVARITWHTFEAVARGLGSRKGRFLSFMGPAVVLLIVLAWLLVLTLGSALIIHPNLGTDFKALHTATTTDFVTALFVGSHSLVIASENNYAPETTFGRLYFTLTGTLGLIVTTLTLTYILHVYTGLQERDTVGLELHLLTDETDDAAELLAGLGAHGHLDSSYIKLGELAAQIVGVDEAYHHYPVLFFFRFKEPYYSVSSVALLALDTVALVKSGLDDEEYRWLKESATLVQLHGAARRLLSTLLEAFLHGPPPKPAEIDPVTAARWRTRYLVGVRRLREAGIKTLADEEEGAATYVALRAEWDYLVTRLAPSLGYSLEEIDPAGSRPEAAAARPEFAARLRAPK